MAPLPLTGEGVKNCYPTPCPLPLTGEGVKAPRSHLRPDFNLHEILWSWLGGIAGITALLAINQILFTGTDLTLVIAPFGASAVLAYGAIQSPLAQPRNIIGGHIVSAIIGVACYKLFNTVPWLAETTSVATAIVGMQITRTLHPPGGATALLAVIGSEQIHKIGWWYVLIPAAAGSTVLVVIALLINNIPTSRRYPNAWF